MSAALRENLILDIHSGCPDGNHPFSHPGGINGVTPASIQISHDRDVNCLNNIPGKIDDVLHLNQTDIRFGQKRASQAKA